MKPNLIDSSERMKENSPIWARAAEIVNAVLKGCLKAIEIKKATSGLARRMIARMLMKMGKFFRMTRGLKSMPTERKKIAMKASFIGRECTSALWCTFVCLMTIPAIKAPKAMEMPKKKVVAVAMRKMRARTERVNSSCERVSITLEK